MTATIDGSEKTKTKAKAKKKKLHISMWKGKIKAFYSSVAVSKSY